MPNQDREDAIINFINEFKAEHNYAPSIDEITEEIGVSSKSMTYATLKDLRAQGRVTWKWNVKRSYVVL